MNALGEYGALMVSPLHRILVKDVVTEILFSETKVLIAAKDLVDDNIIRPVKGGEVQEVHLLFDRHQVIYSKGPATESFLLGPQTARPIKADTLRRRAA